MRNISDTCKKLIVIIIAIGLLSLIIGLIFSNEKLAFVKGVSFGTIFSVLRIILTDRSINKTVNQNRGNAQVWALLNFLVRYCLIGVVFIVAALEPSISLLGTFIGVLTMPLSAYVYKLVEKFKKSEV